MAEAIGLIASVVQVAGAGLKLSQTLYQYADGVASAERRIKDIAKEIELTSGVIDELGDIFKQDETASLISKNAVNTANDTMKECSVVFAEIEATLTKSKKGKMGRLMLPFRDNKLELLRSHIDKLKDTLQLLMQVLTHVHLVSSKKLDREAEVKQREEIKQLLENKKQSTRRYEESLRNFSVSDRSTAVDDDQASNKEDDAGNSTAALTMAASAIASTINPETLAKCVDHVRSLLQDIETLQQALATTIDGEDHSGHHQRTVGSYFRARSHLDSVLLGNSGVNRPNAQTQPVSIAPNPGDVAEGIQTSMAGSTDRSIIPGDTELARAAQREQEKTRAKEAEKARVEKEAKIRMQQEAEQKAKFTQARASAEMMKNYEEKQLKKAEHGKREAKEPKIVKAQWEVDLEQLRLRAQAEHDEWEKREKSKREAREAERIEGGSDLFDDRVWSRPVAHQFRGYAEAPHLPEPPGFHVEIQECLFPLTESYEPASQPPACDMTSMPFVAVSERKPAKTTVKKQTPERTTENDAAGERRVGRGHVPARPTARDEAHAIRKRMEIQSSHSLRRPYIQFLPDVITTPPPQSHLPNEDRQVFVSSYSVGPPQHHTVSTTPPGSPVLVPTSPVSSPTSPISTPGSPTSPVSTPGLPSLPCTSVVSERRYDVMLERAHNTVVARDHQLLRLNHICTIEQRDPKLNEKSRVHNDESSATSLDLHYPPFGAQAESRSQALQDEIDATVDILRDNIDKASERGARVKDLDQKPDNLTVSAQAFRRGANQRKSSGLWDDFSSWHKSRLSSTQGKNNVIQGPQDGLEIPGEMLRNLDLEQIGRTYSWLREERASSPYFASIVSIPGSEGSSVSPNPKQEQKMPLNSLLREQSLGSWANEMNDKTTTQHILKSLAHTVGESGSQSQLQQSIPMVDVNKNESWSMSGGPPSPTLANVDAEKDEVDELLREWTTVLG